MSKGSLSALAVALSLGLVTAAEAEDWTGFFATVGLSASKTDMNLTPPGMKGGIGPGTGGDDVAPYAAVGYDWQVGGLTLGVLADIDAMDGRQDYLTLGKNYIGDADIFATLRGRVGVPVNDSMRVYASAGAAFIETSVKAVTLIGDVTESGRQTGAVAGIGLEYALPSGPNVTVEYIHADFGRATAIPGSIEQDPKIDALRLGLTFRF